MPQCKVAVLPSLATARHLRIRSKLRSPSKREDGSLRRRMMPHLMTLRPSPQPPLEDHHSKTMANRSQVQKPRAKMQKARLRMQSKAKAANLSQWSRNRCRSRLPSRISNPPPISNKLLSCSYSSSSRF